MAGFQLVLVLHCAQYKNTMTLKYEAIILLSSNPTQMLNNVNTFLYSKVIQSGSALRLLTVFITGLGLFFLRFSIMGKQAPDFSPSDNPAANCEERLTRVLTFLYLPAFNFWLLLCPRTLSFDWSMDSIPLVESLLDPRCLIIIIFYVFLAILGFYCLNGCATYFETMVENNFEEEKYKKEPFSAAHKKDHLSRNGKKHTGTKKSTDAEISSSSGQYFYQNNNLPARTFNIISRHCLLQAALVSVGILTLSFLPASNLFFYVGFVVAERILYIPSIGYCLLIAIGADVIWSVCNAQQKKMFCSLLICVLVLFCARTMRRNWDWQNEETLYR